MSRLKFRSAPPLLVPFVLVVVTGCATSEAQPPTLFDRLAVVGEHSAAVGAGAWRETRRRLGLGRRDAVLDEVDLAMMEEDAVLPPALMRNAPATATRSRSDAVAVSAVPRRTDIRVVETVETDDAATFARSGSRDAVVAMNDVLDDTDEPRDTESVDPAAASPARRYVVQAGETLWSIARSETGDATNWKRLAEANDLPAGVSLHADATLRIPATLDVRRVRPDESSPTVEALADSESEAANTMVRASTRASATEPDLAAAKPNEMEAGVDAVGSRAASPGAVSFTLEAGESLWELAKRATGDATNWERIAARNDIAPADVGLLHSGRVLLVPQALTRAESGQVVSIEPGTTPQDEPASVEPVSEDGREAGRQGSRSAIPATTDDAAPRATPGAAPETSADIPATAADAETARDAGAATMDETAAADAREPGTDEPARGAAIRAVAGTAAALEAARREPKDEPARIVEARYRDARQDPAHVRVRGSYYPKAVYRQADFSSELLMRVSPGTAIRVSRAMGPWYEVLTDKGTGYMHSRDIR